MPRVGPNYTLPEPPFQPQTPISSAAVNSDLSDIADALTDSLARNGAGGMTAVLPLANAGFSYSSDPNTGMHRSGADAQAIECGGVDIVDVTTSGATVNGNLEVTGNITSGGAALLPIGLGPLPWSGLTAPPKWVLAGGQELLRASYPALWAFVQTQIAGGNTLYTNGNGTTTFTVPDFRGRVPAGNDSMVLGSANRLTAATITPAANILGAVNTAAGGQLVTLNVTQIPSHSHANSLNDPGHSHTINVYPGAGGQTLPLHANRDGVAAGNSGGINTSTTGMSINNAAEGGGGAHSNVQPTIITNYIIYAGA